MEIIKMEGEVLMTKRYWWQVYKRNWHKHTDLWGGLWWIRYKWNKDQEQLIKINKIMELGTKQFNDSAMEMFGGKPKQQTAVEWFANAIEGLDTGVSYHFFQEMLEQAKEMEKQQIIEACDSNFTYGNNGYPTLGEIYYNEKFKNK